MDPHPSEGALQRVLGVRQVAATAVNSIVGSGIFVLPAVVAGILGSSAILAYAVCGAAVALVVLCFAELASRFPLSGGMYTYVEAAFGRYVGFLAGALYWFGTETIASAAISNVFVASLGQLVPALAGRTARAVLIIALFTGLAAINVRGVKLGARLVELSTAAKLAPLVILVAVGAFAVHPAFLTWEGMPPGGDLGRASVALFFAFQGIETCLTPTGEVRDPSRTMPRAVLLALGVVLVLYASVQLVAQGVLGPELVTNQSAPLAAAAERLLGNAGRVLVLVGATVSTFGTVAGNMMAVPRVLFAFARDGLAPARLGAVHSQFRTPYAAIITHAAVCCGFAVVGSFGPLAVLSGVATLIVYLACCVATLVLRQRGSRSDRPTFTTPGPWVPLLAAAVVCWILSSATRRELVVVAWALGAATVLYWFRRRQPVPALTPPRAAD